MEEMSNGQIDSLTCCAVRYHFGTLGMVVVGLVWHGMGCVEGERGRVDGCPICA